MEVLNFTKKPNIIIIKSDQQRADTIGAIGNEHMITPNMDKLAKEGVTFSNAFCCGATCIASRAAFYTGRYPHNTGVYGFDNWSHLRTWLHDFKDSGYHLSAVGKVHHKPAPSYMAYDERIYAENFPEFTDYDDFSNYLTAEGQEDPCKLLTKDGNWLDKCCCSPYPLAEKYFVDNYIGRMAVNWVSNYNKDNPFFLHIGFVGPHDPFVAPQKFIDMYCDRNIPEPVGSADSYKSKPPQFKRFMEKCINPAKFSKSPGYGVYQVRLDDKTLHEIKDMRCHYYARITAIDEQIGFIMQALQQRGFLENSVVIFTSDHGENLGDHGMMYKWLMTEQSTRVPMIIRLPNAQRGGFVDTKLFSHIDTGPTLLSLAGIDSLNHLDGKSNMKRLLYGDSSQIPEKVYCEDNYLTMIRTESEKLVYYAGQPYGEYYDLTKDPNELKNRYNNPHCNERVKALKLNLLEWFSTSRYLGSITEVDTDGKNKRYWPEHHLEDPYILSGQPRPERTKLDKS